MSREERRTEVASRKAEIDKLLGRNPVAVPATANKT